MVSPGDKIKHYEIIRLLGKGGMGEVYLAHDTILDRKVALKFLPEELEGDARTEERFLREAKSAAALDHPFICKIYETGEWHGKAFIAMEYIEGKTLEDRMGQAPLTLKDGVRITLEIAEALENAHKTGIVHRDLKPANIMITSQGHTKVMDFGLAKRVLPGGGTAELSRTLTQASITEQGSIAGTIAYMSPEQAKGEKVDTRSDIFSLGIILYEMLSGKHPFSKPSPIETLTSILRDSVPAPHITPKSVNPVLNPILRKALAKKPADRYQNIADFANDLRKAQTETGFRIRIPLRTLSIVGASVLIIALAVVGILKFRHPSKEGASKPIKTGQKPISVLIADFENKTGDPAFEGAIEQGFGMGLEGAPFIKMFDRARARTLMNELDATANGKIKADAAPLLCSREGINLVITGSISIESNGKGYHFDVWALDPLSYLRLAERSKTITSKAEVFKAADSLVAEIRDDLSQIPAETVQALSMETFTAASLEAMKIYAHAQDLVKAGKEDEAIKEYQKALEKDPKMGRAYSGLALIYRNRGQDEEANKHFEKAMALIDQMTDREKYRTRGAYYFLNRNAKKAVEEYSALIRQFPMDSAAHTNLPLAYFYNREMQKAFDEGQKAAEFAPRNIIPRNNLVWYAMVLGKFDVAEKEYQEVMKMNPEFFDALIPLALIQLAQDRPREAEKTYLELSSKDARLASMAAIGLADLALYEGRLNDALKILVAGLASDLKNKFEDEASLKAIMRAETFLAQGKLDAAIQAADRIAASGNKGSNLFSIALIYIQAGQSERATKIAAELNTKPNPELQAYARLIEGEIMLKKGSPPEAVKLFHESQAVLDTWLSHLALGRAYLEAKEYIEAHSEFDMCLKRKGEMTSIFLDDFPSYRYFAPVYYYLGRAQEGLKSPAAKESYEKFLKLKERADPGDPLVADARERLARL
jgi:serine/threonine protein kinase/tetratricopeptide (TPR) repeat protein